MDILRGSMPQAVLAFICLIPATAAAQVSVPPPPAPARGGVAVGIALTPAVAGRPELWPTVRLSGPLGARVGFDLDAGRMTPAASDYFRTRWFTGAQGRFLSSLRQTDGSSRYWVVGHTLIRGTAFDGQGHVTAPRRTIHAARLGYGGDRVYSNGVRAAGELIVIGGGGDSPMGFGFSVIVQWGLRRADLGGPRGPS